jgi:ferrous iron transport protein B
MVDFTIALAGNPNAGKSTIFNALTGSHQHVGNWPGKTVEKKQGVFKYDGLEVQVVDLPGTYSLSAYSLEEQIARDFIVKEKPGLVVNVADAANLERNLYLTTQILETGTPIIIALNMMDVAHNRALRIDTQKLSQVLNGIPVISTTASRRQGLEVLKQAIATYAESSYALPANTEPQTTYRGTNEHGCPKCRV